MLEDRLLGPFFPGTPFNYYRDFYCGLIGEKGLLTVELSSLGNNGPLLCPSRWYNHTLPGVSLQSHISEGPERQEVLGGKEPQKQAMLV